MSVHVDFKMCGHRDALEMSTQEGESPITSTSALTSTFELVGAFSMTPCPFTTTPAIDLIALR